MNSCKKVQRLNKSAVQIEQFYIDLAYHYGSVILDAIARLWLVCHVILKAYSYVYSSIFMWRELIAEICMILLTSEPPRSISFAIVGVIISEILQGGINNQENRYSNAWSMGIYIAG